MAQSEAEAGELVRWAVWAVSGLHYLLDIDEETFGANLNTRGHSAEAVDLAHVRWAAATAMTAVDLCAAALGRRLRFGGPVRDPVEFDIAHFDATQGDAQQQKKAAQRVQQLTSADAAWVHSVLWDPCYAIVRNARAPLVHRRLPRDVIMGTALREPHDYRTGFRVE